MECKVLQIAVKDEYTVLDFNSIVLLVTFSI